MSEMSEMRHGIGKKNGALLGRYDPWIDVNKVGG